MTISRRTMLLAMTAASLHADEAQDVLDLFTQMASALSAADAGRFMEACDRNLPGYQVLEMNVDALVAEATVTSAVDVVSDNGDAMHRTVELDWFLQIVQLEAAIGSTERRSRIHCQLMREKKRWRITSLDPISFFAPPKPR